MLGRGDVPPMGRGSRQVMSCGLVRKRHGAGRPVKVRGAEREISARLIDVLLIRDSRRKQRSHGV
jgi:hypothetical protein